MREKPTKRKIRIAVLSTALVVLSLSCPPSGAIETAAGGETAADPEAALLTYLEAWNTGELDGLADVVTPDFERHAGPAEGCASLDDLRDLITATRGVYKHLRITIEDSVVDRDRGAFRGRFHGVHQAVNGVVEFPLMAMLRFADGRLAEEWILGNNFLALMGLGYELLPPGFEAILPSGEHLAAQDLDSLAHDAEDVRAASTVVLASTRTARPNEALLDAYLEAWKSGEVGGLAAVVADDFTRHGSSGRVSSRQELEGLITGYHGSHRNLRMEVLDSFAGREKGAIRWRSQGSNRDTGFKVDGITYSMLRFEGGKIAEEWVLGNSKDRWTGMGYRILPPGSKMVAPPVEDPPGARVPPRPRLDPTKLRAFAEATYADPPRAAGELEITTDVDSLLALDGKPIGGLEAGATVVLRLEKGKHEIRASSVGGSVFYQGEIEISKAEKEQVAIAAPAKMILHLQNRTVEDLESGLMWPVTDNGADITQEAAQEHCETSVHGGHADWRLPSIYELETIYNPDAEKKRFRTVDGITLTGCCPWTLSPQGEFHWTLFFYNGQRYIKYGAIGKPSRALCVRYAGG